MVSQSLIERVEEVRRIVADNGAEWSDDITVESVLEGVAMMVEDGMEWTVEDELQDLIWESWGEDC